MKTAGELIYEGKAKKIFSTSDENIFLMKFKNSLTAFNALKKGEFEGKGSLNCQISTHFFKILKQNNIPLHWLETISNDEMKVLKTNVIPLEVVVRNFTAGSIVKKLGLQEGVSFSKPLIEFYYKKDELQDPFVSTEQILHFEWATEKDIEEIKEHTFKINQILKTEFAKVGLRLVDFKIEFGKDTNGKILLCDEISPDSMRIWDEKTLEKLDKDRFRLDLGSVEKGYQEILNRLTQK